MATSPRLRERLLADSDHAVRSATLLAHHTGPPMPSEVFVTLPDPPRALERCRLAPESEAELVRDGSAEVRRALASDPGLSRTASPAWLEPAGRNRGAPSRGG